MIRTYWKPFAAGVVGILLGLLLFQIVRHLWQDHAALHELAVIELQRQQQGSQAK